MGLSIFTEEEEDLIEDAWPELAIIDGKTDAQVFSKAYRMGLKRGMSCHASIPKPESYIVIGSQTGERPPKKLTRKSADYLSNYINRYY